MLPSILQSEDNMARYKKYSGKICTIQHPIDSITTRRSKETSNYPSIRYEDDVSKMFDNRNRTISQQIRQLDQRIRFCKRKLMLNKQIQPEQDTEYNSLGSNYQQISKFDYLTNPNHQQIQQEKQIQVKAIKKVDFMSQNKTALSQHYSRSLRHKFQRRQQFPHRQIRRRVPRFLISHADMNIRKPASQIEHQFRILSKEVTPTQIYPTIPQFGVVKDNVSKNIMAYLFDYKPFIERARQQI